MARIIRKLILSIIGCSLLLLGAVGSLAVFAANENEPIFSACVSKNVAEDSVYVNVYNISDNGEAIYSLVISGSGYMKDFIYPDLPEWYAYSEKIISVKIEEGVNNIGKNSFSDLYELREIRIENKNILIEADDYLIFEYAKIFSHMNSTAKAYSDLFSREFEPICSFDNGVCTVCGYECTNHRGGTPSCTEPSKCIVCKKQYGEPSPHILSDWIEPVAPSCTEDGAVGHYKCESCNSFIDENNNILDSVVIKSIGHTYGDLIIGKAPTCEEAGYISHYLCSVCNKYFDSDQNEILLIKIPELYHNGGEADCTDKAVCTVCGKHYGNLNPDNHSFSAEWFFDSEAHFHICKCGKKSDITSHSFEGTVTKPPTEESDGEMLYKCVCGKSFDAKIPKLESDTPLPGVKVDNKIGAVSVILIILTSLSMIFAVAVLLWNLKKK